MIKRDVINDLVSDHWQMRDLLKELRREDLHSRRKHSLVKKLALWLKTHAKGEEKTIFAYGRAHRATQVLAYEDIEEHNTLNSLLRKLEHTHGNPQLWAARLHLLCEILEHHLDEEEEEYFPLLREMLGAPESEKMSKRYRALTEELDPMRPHPQPGLLGWLSSRPEPFSADISPI